MQLERGRRACANAKKEAYKSVALAVGFGLIFLAGKTLANVGAAGLYALDKVDEPVENLWPGYETGKKISDVYERCSG